MRGIGGVLADTATNGSVDALDSGTGDGQHGDQLQRPALVVGGLMGARQLPFNFNHCCGPLSISTTVVAAMRWTATVVAREGQP